MDNTPTSPRLFYMLRSSTSVTSCLAALLLSSSRTPRKLTGENHVESGLKPNHRVKKLGSPPPRQKAELHLIAEKRQRNHSFSGITRVVRGVATTAGHNGRLRRSPIDSGAMPVPQQQ